MVELVVFLAGDDLGDLILEELIESATENFHVIAHNPSSNFLKLVTRSGGKAQIVSTVSGKPDWDKIGDLVIKFKSVRGFSWFPFIFPQNFINLFDAGILNIHNSYLPFNRGRHSTFWAIMDGTQFGASIHWVSKGIDAGFLVERIEVEASIFANASLIYKMQLGACLKLAKKFIPLLHKEINAGVAQNEADATFHFSQDILAATTFSNESAVTWDEVVRLVRATATDKGCLRILYSDGRELRLRGSVID